MTRSGVIPRYSRASISPRWQNPVAAPPERTYTIFGEYRQRRPSERTLSSMVGTITSFAWLPRHIRQFLKKPWQGTLGKESMQRSLQAR